MQFLSRSICPGTLPHQKHLFISRVSEKRQSTPWHHLITAFQTLTVVMETQNNAFYLVYRTLSLPDQEGSWFLALLVYEGKYLQSLLLAILKMDFSVVFSLPLPQNQVSVLTKITLSCTKELKTRPRRQKCLSSAQ